jgi:hypothetical protein
MEMTTVKLKFTNIEEGTSFSRAPVAGDWIKIRGDEYLVSKVILKPTGTAIVIIDSELKSPKERRGRLNIDG